MATASNLAPWGLGRMLWSSRNTTWPCLLASCPRHTWRRLKQKRCSSQLCHGTWRPVSKILCNKIKKLIQHNFKSRIHNSVFLSLKLNCSEIDLQPGRGRQFESHIRSFTVQNWTGALKAVRRSEQYLNRNTNHHLQPKEVRLLLLCYQMYYKLYCVAVVCWLFAWIGWIVTSVVGVHFVFFSRIVNNF